MGTQWAGWAVCESGVGLHTRGPGVETVVYFGVCSFGCGDDSLVWWLRTSARRRDGRGVGLCSDGGFSVGYVHRVRDTEAVVAWIECTGGVCMLHMGAWSRVV